ncbi:MAG: hypothetical protein JSU87_17850, partial [Gemmatimonadota bacterium]
LRYGHRSRLIDHGKTDGIANFITLIGVRYTTGRYEAERAVNLVFRKLGHRPPECRTATTPVFGGEIGNWADFLAEVKRKGAGRFGEAMVESLAHNYGAGYEAVLGLVDEDPALAKPIGNSTTLRAEVVHAVRYEMAETLADVVFRRTDVATGSYPGRVALRECAELFAAERPSKAATVESQLDEIAARFPARVVKRIDQNAGAAAG